MTFKDFYNKVLLSKLVRTLLEKIPGFNRLTTFVDGKKTEIGRIGLFFSALLALIQQHFCSSAECPEIPHFAKVVAITSYVILELGLMHSDDKVNRFGTAAVKVDPKTKEVVSLDKKDTEA